MRFTAGAGPCRLLLGGLLAGLATVAIQPAVVTTSELSARRAPLAIVSGLVFDSIAGLPLVDVSVFYTSADDSLASPRVALTDSTGRYAFDDLAPGRYVAGFTPTPLDSLGFASPPVVVEVVDGTQRIDLATPSAATIARAICGTRQSDTTALLLGHVRDTRRQQPLVGASVLVDWNEIIVQGTSLLQRGRVLVATTNGPGWFAVCDLPGDVFVTLRAAHGADTSGFMEVPLRPGSVHHVSFLVGGASSVATATAPAGSGVTSARAEQPATPVWRGSARLSGTITDDRGQPVRDATVEVWGAGRSATTNEHGTFILDSLPGGTQTIEARLIGFEPVRRVVQLAADRPAEVSLAFGQRVVVLEGMRVTGQLMQAQRLAAFETRRRQSTSGIFLGPEELARRPAMPLSSVIRAMPGMKVVCAQGECSVLMKGLQVNEAGPNECVPSLYVNGVRDMLGDFSFLYTDEIAAIEVYPRVFGKPVEFNDMNACGAIVVWTRPLAPDAQRRRP